MAIKRKIRVMFRRMLRRRRSIREQLPAAVQRLVPFGEVAKVGVVDCGRTRVFIIDTSERALVIRAWMGSVRNFRFSRQSHDALMHRYGRLVHHGKLLHGERS